MNWSKQWEGAEHLIWDGQMGAVWMHIYKHKKTKKFSLTSNLVCQRLSVSNIRAAKEEAERVIVSALHESLGARSGVTRRNRTYMDYVIESGDG